jgi:DNA polymerase III alpha subunit (gram-positive type)
MIPLLTVDVETTGLDANENEIIELGAVLSDWETKKPLVIQSSNIIFNGDLPREIQDITGIEPFMLQPPFAVSLKTALIRLAKLGEVAQAYVAHNATFDKGFITEAFKKCGLPGLPPRTWIDTRFDLPYPEKQSSFKLNYLLADHGLFNPFAHRAVFDCMSTNALMGQYDFNEILELAQSEMIIVEAVEADGRGISFDRKDLAKEKGFRWEGNTKQWTLQIKRARYDKIKDSFPFDTEVIFEVPF